MCTFAGNKNDLCDVAGGKEKNIRAFLRGAGV